MSEDAPPPRRPRTPAEEAGATPLDPERLRATAGGGPPRRTIDTVRDPDGGPVEEVPAVRRRRRTAARAPVGPRSVRGWLALAAVAALSAVAVAVVAVATDADPGVSAPEPPATRVATPVLSARRVPELLVRPIGASRLAAAVDPVLAAAPPQTCVAAVDRNGAVLERNAAAPLLPASNLKLVTAGAVLAGLDPGSRLVTRVAADGEPTDGATVEGNLYMVGGGDPLLSTGPYLEQLPNGVPPASRLEDLADRVAATGVRRVTGSVVGDDSRHEQTRAVSSWPDRFVTQGQVAPLSALTVDDAWTVGVGVSDDPAVHAAATLTELLEARGVQVDGDPVRGVTPEGAAPLAELPSLTVAEMVEEGLAFSDNTTMELLTRELGLATSGQATTAAGTAAVQEWLAETHGSSEGIVVADGSGLSPSNRMTCAALADVLAADGADGTIAAGLAVPGQPGTLVDRLLEGPLTDRLRAKTGTLRDATALSGWLDTRPGAQLAASVVVNRPGGSVTAEDTELTEDVLAAMLDHPAVPPRESVVPAPAVPT